MAAIGRELSERIPIMYLATVRRDGAPRVHPVCPIWSGDAMYIAVAPVSPKRHDLRRDGRYALHALPGKQDAEFYVTGRARLVPDGDERAAVVAAAGHTVHPADDVFELGIDEAMTAYWENWAKPDTYAVRRWWPPR
jgi:hypothetical protein